jgi:hypothetical protein
VPLLRDPQRERFCREVVEQYLAMPPSSAPVQAAYVAAGFRPNRANAHRFAGRPEIRQRIQELMSEALEYSDMRISRAAVTLDHIASATLSDFYEADGSLKNLARLPAQLADAVKKIEYPSSILSCTTRCGRYRRFCGIWAACGMKVLPPTIR